ncbi:ORF V: Enzymatic polyprotein [Labeo rohita]|uniref:ribonuclease H n=1 Tax=Labeo rohita TaxID=84645 RepID=A0ABQ8MWG4_LABRO|nr:ORF V: Enzymatic polyprotein [Labeo rohita]
MTTPTSPIPVEDREPLCVQTLPSAQYKVLTFGLSLSPRVFTKVTEAALSPLWRMGIRILNYLDDWLLIAHSRDVLCEHRDLVLQHLSHLSLQVNREKSKLSPVQRISFLGVELDSVNMTARLTNERAQSVLNCLNSFRHKTAVPLKTFQRLLGHMAAAATVTPLGLLHMRPLQHWLHDRVPRWAWHHGTLRIGVSLQCRRLFSPWSDPAFLQAGVPLGQVSRHLVVYTDASSTGWGAVCNGQAASGSWTGPRLQWHINCLELLAVLLALRRFRPMLRHNHVLVRTDSTTTIAYINHQGGLRSRRMSQLARHLLLWSQTRLKLLRAIHIPGELNRAADQLSRQSTHPGKWRLHPQVVQLIWSHFGEAQIDLFASPESSHCQLFYSLSEAPLGRDALAHSWPLGPKYAFPPVSLLAQTLCKIREDEEQVLLVAPYWPTRTWFPDLISLAAAPPWKIPLRRDLLSRDGHNLAPASRPMEPARLAPGRDASDLSGLSQAVIDTITQSRAPSTRQAYALRWGLFVDWCSSHGEDPQRCPIAVVLSFLQEKVERRLSRSTLKVYVAAIAAYHDAVDGASLGKHQLVVKFLRGARRVNPPRPHLVPSWDLSVTLQGLREAPFEPLAQRSGDLQAFSVDEACLEFGPDDSHVILRPWPGYVPKVPTTPFRDQVVNLQALPLEEADPASALLCPVRALRIYVDHTRHFRRTEQLFVCFGGQQKGNAVSKQRLAHWVVDAISLSYQNQGPAGVGLLRHSYGIRALYPSVVPPREPWALHAPQSGLAAE